MDTLSSSVSTLKVPTLLSSTSSRELHQFNPQSPRTHKLPPQSHLHSTIKPNLISNKTPSFSHKLVSLSSTPSFLNSSATLSLNSSSSSDLHRKPATGYAAALLDIAQCNSSVHLVEKDIQRFLKLLHNKQVQAALANPFVGEKEKGQVVNLVAEKGRFNRHLVGLVKMLVRKNKVGIVKEVLEEFQRIYNELSGTAKKDGASKEDIEQLSKFKFRKVGNEKVAGDTQGGGVMTECGTDSPIEHVLSQDDAECCICLSSYDDGVELRQLPCGHHFHCSCIDKWLYINATCPLCKYNILKSTSHDPVEV